VALREAGYVVEHCVAVLDREEGAEEALRKEWVTLHSLYRKSDFSTADDAAQLIEFGLKILELQVEHQRHQDWKTKEEAPVQMDERQALDFISRLQALLPTK
jgi:orotate phosphoribosyltransferase